MKRILLLLYGVFLCTGFLQAREINSEQARQTATRFWQSAPATRAMTPSWQLVHPDTQSGTRSGGEAPAYYIFDNTNGPGFVIVAGDDVAMPVLGYSFENEFPERSLPENLKMWLDWTRESVNKARKEGLSAESGVSQAWSATRAGSQVVKLETALWDQTEPYNLLCPIINGANAYTGCTATAMAIAIRYHRWPEHGVGTVPSYVSPTMNVTVPEVQLGHAYDWDNMPLRYDGAYSQDQATAVATLMRDCAVMLQSDFGPVGSSGTSAYSSDIPDLLINYLDYDKQTHWIYRPDYPTAEWNQLMQNELNNDRVILYSGHNPSSGHAFILDGYTSDNYYSVNWGWSGYCNGYFLLTALDPDGQGAGGSDHYNDSQTAIIGIQRNAGNDYFNEMRFTRFTDDDGRKYNGISLKGDLHQGETPLIDVGLICSNGGLFTGEYILAVTDDQNQIIQTILSEQVENLKGGSGYYWYDVPLVLDGPVLPKYRLRVLYKSEKMTEWAVVRGNDEDGCVWDLLLGDPYTIEETTEFSYDRRSRTIRLQLKEGVSVALQGDDGSNYSDLCQNEDAQHVRIDASTLPGGAYLLVLRKDSERKELRIKLAAPNE